MKESKIKITIDETAKWVKLFEKIKSLTLTKLEIFKYAVFMLEAPEHIKDSNFEYLQSKIPGLDLLFSDHIQLQPDAIINLSNDDRMKKMISEAIWVGVWLKYSTVLLDVVPSAFRKIDTPLKWKYLDYSVVKDWKKYHIETKWTVWKYHSEMKKDILSKKESSRDREDVYLEFWTIIKLKSKWWTGISECIVVDDPPSEKAPLKIDDYGTKIKAYSIFLSYILDPKYYNKFIKPVLGNKKKKIKIDKNKFFGSYEFNWKIFYWEFFDYRLVKDNLIWVILDANLQKTFKRISDKVWKTKFFIWIDEDVLSAINHGNKDFISHYETTRVIESDSIRDVFLDKDGIIIIKSIWGGDKKIEGIFTENEVKNRLWLYMDYIRWYATECWAPCRSRDLRWKPCAIKTYRGNCHYHR